MLNMAGDGSRVRIGLRRSTDGHGIVPTTMLPTPSDAHVIDFPDLRINLSPLFLSAANVGDCMVTNRVQPWWLHRDVLKCGDRDGPLPKRSSAPICIHSLGLGVVVLAELMCGISQTSPTFFHYSKINWQHLRGWMVLAPQPTNELSHQ